MHQDSLDFFTWTKVTFLISFLGFWVAVLFFNLIKRTSWGSKIAFAPAQKKLRSPKLAKTLKLVLFNQSLSLLFTAASYPMIKALPFNFDAFLTWPFIILAIVQIHFFMLCENGLFYLFHRIFHQKFLFKHIHSIHHQYKYPEPISAIYTHPIEFVIGNIFPLMSGPILWTLLGFSLSLYVFWIWVGIRMFETVWAHSGLEFPFFLPHCWIKKIFFSSQEISGAKAHFFHHFQNEGMYGTFFLHLDKIFKTYKLKRS